MAWSALRMVPVASMLILFPPAARTWAPGCRPEVMATNSAGECALWRGSQSVVPM